MLLSSILAPAVRTPALRVLASGDILPGVTQTEILSNSHYAADRFRLSAVVTARQAAAWSTTTQTVLDIQASLDQQSWTSLLQGYVDTVSLDPVTGTIQLAGRDLSAPLIDSRTQETFANQTSSDIANSLAARHGLTADVQPTTTPVGSYWQIEHDSLTLNHYCHATTEWDLLTTLARLEAFAVWVDGSTLHFRPAPPAAPPPVTLRPVATPYGPANVTSLHLERTLTLARDLTVTVRSWNSRQSRAFTQTARASRSSHIRSGTSAKPLQYVYVIPNLTPDEALKIAQARLAELTQHERVIHAEMPGELTLTPRTQLRLEGTATDFDQSYTIDEIERRFDLIDGFTQRIRARNVSQAA